MTLNRNLSGTLLLSGLMFFYPFTLNAAGNIQLDDKYFFQLIDLNGNQEITLAEFSIKRMDVFLYRDSNQDGNLSLSELPELSTDFFKSIDSNDNKVISVFEFAMGKETIFGYIDENSDGLIDINELIGFRKKMN